MKCLLVVLLSFFSCAWSHPFFEEDDPTLYQHVNVISGNLVMSFQDVCVQGPISFPITRTYSSSGAMECFYGNTDEELRSIRKSGWMFQGGWTFLPHANMLKEAKYDCHCLYNYSPGTVDKNPPTPKCAYIYIPEQSGSIIEYSCAYNKKEGRHFLPKDLKGKISGSLSPRKDPKRNILKFESDKKAVLSLPDGTKRYYSSNKEEGFWLLDLEVLPSKHQIAYHYTKKDPKQLIRIELQNPAGTKTFSSIDLDHNSFNTNKTLFAKTSDGKALTYKMGKEYKDRIYLESVTANFQPGQEMHYEPGKKGAGARIHSMALSGRQKFNVTYYPPKSRKERRKKESSSKHFSKADKVQILQIPHPENGELLTFAEFSYLPKMTEVCDYEGVITRYHHDDKNLQRIEYFNNQGEKHSEISFEWENGALSSKTLFDASGTPLFKKRFIYGPHGVVLDEVFIDYKTHIQTHRSFLYYPDSYLTCYEEQEGGLACNYEYLLDTDLLTKKLISKDGSILQREFYVYNSDHLLISTIFDDGNASDPYDLSGVTERKIKRFDLDPQTGICKSVTESYLDSETFTECIYLTRLYEYSEKLEVTAEEITYGPSGKSFTLHTDYDPQGHIIKQTTPLGREHIFKYDEYGDLIEAKEVGAQKKKFTYDKGHRPTRCLEGDRLTQSFYDVKGRLYKQIDPLNHVIEQKFDCFGRCTATHLPDVLDENGQSYEPIITSTYDTEGNLISYTNPRGETTIKAYNGMRKPLVVCYPDGSETSHEYNRDGTLLKTIEPDLSEIHYTYDGFQRMLTKRVLSSTGEELCSEEWEYNTFHLFSYTDSLGLTTYYSYDGLGRKIEERAEGRITTFTYDVFGNVERINRNGASQVRIHNVEGEITEQWEEDSSGKIENYMVFFYDKEGRKERATRTTSQGIATDQFFYDPQGRLIQHIDPNGETTHFLYTVTSNQLGQVVEIKSTIDPVGNITAEIPDANGRLVSAQKKSPSGQLVSSEELFYDRAGNKAKRISTIFQDLTPSRTYTTCWEYNNRGWPIKEIEEGSKCTEFDYDPVGRLTQKTMPNGVILYQKFDGLGRLLGLHSSDNSIHYTYSYHLGFNPTLAQDKIQHLTWERSYNLFGELVLEKRPNETFLEWEYDHSGRCRVLHLPDHSSIEYIYTDLHLASVNRFSSQGILQYTHTYTSFDENGHVHEEQAIKNLGTIRTDHDLLERPIRQRTPWNKFSIRYGPSGLVRKTKNSFFGDKTYEYDPLNQLRREGNQEYAFDSLGNPLDAQVNHFNQIVADGQTSFYYDINGPPIREHGPNHATTYEYDSLNRLTAIDIPNERHIHYVYDPFGRLYSKEIYANQASFWSSANSWSRDVAYYLYDKDKEIGTLDEHRRILELKIIGLGILGEIGGAVALELDNQFFIPLHDFSGNIIALISSKGAIAEKYDIDAFGKNTLKTSSKNPWRFNSKRVEEHLIFFGERFYHPQLGRWLTPDPAGAIDSPNLYLYVRNSPLNRLDLFGLMSEDFRIEINKDQIESKNFSILYGQAFMGDLKVDLIFYQSQLHALQFRPEEIEAGSINLLDHFNELFTKEGMAIGLVTEQNGVQVGFTEFCLSFNSFVKEIPGDPLIVGVHVPTNGKASDVGKALKEVRRNDTSEVVSTRQIMVAFAEALDKVNPNLLWMHRPHSRAGGIGVRAIEGMSDDEQKLIHDKLLWLGLAPSLPLDKSKARDSINYYSESDYITGPIGRAYVELSPPLYGRLSQDRTYNIEFLPCESKWSEKTGYFTDHAKMGTTYRSAFNKALRGFERDYGFYKNNR